MGRPYLSPRCLLFVGTIATLAAVAYAQSPRRSQPLILGADEGDAIGTHYIKADPQLGSPRLGVGLQRLRGGQGIPLHVHEKEDEVLFVHSGSGVGAVGDERRAVAAGATLYIPQGTWHGIESRSDELAILWVVSPPHFADALRARALARDGKISSAELNAITRQQGYRDGGDFFLPRLEMIAAALALGGAIAMLWSGAHPVRAIATYAGSATLATTLTMRAVAPGYLPPISFAIVSVTILAAASVGALGGVGILRLMRRQ